MADKKPMTKKEVTDYMSQKIDMTKKATKEFLDELAQLAYKETKKKGEFTVPGIGKLVVDRRKARKGRNPATGEEIRIPAKKVVKFRVSKAVKDAVVGE